MAYTLRGRLETRVAVSLLPLLVAAVLAPSLHVWWPLELAALMIGVGLAADVAFYHRLLPYQPGWVALPLGAAELAVVMGLAVPLSVDAPLGPALAFFGGSWLLAQLLGHAVFPLRHLSYGEDGGELGRAGPATAAAVLTVLAAAGGVAWGTQPPTVHLPAGVHQGPLVLDYEQVLDGEPGAVVRGGIVVKADGVTVRDVTVVGGEYGISVERADRVLLDDVHVRGAVLDGINARRSRVTIRDCSVAKLQSPYGQGIDISFSADLPPSVIEDCTLTGGQEGIFADSVNALIKDNHVSETTLRGITVTEMSMVTVEDNDVENVLGIGIFCSDYSHCHIEENSVRDTRPDHSSSDSMRKGYAIVSHYWSHAFLADNEVYDSPGGVGSFSDAHVYHE
jgi:nitrous oxidase accessory protein NosD